MDNDTVILGIFPPNAVLSAASDGARQAPSKIAQLHLVAMEQSDEKSHGEENSIATDYTASLHRKAFIRSPAKAFRRLR